MPAPTITVFAGTNGAGKSSVIGAYLLKTKGVYFNPDDVARDLRKSFPSLTQSQINGYAWSIGKNHLENALAEGKDYTFETTLGGNTIPELLGQASKSHNVDIHFVGLRNVDLHISRVKERVAKGGHDIPEHKIRERYTKSVANLIVLLEGITYLKLYDNSGPPDEGPTHLLEVDNGVITYEAKTMPHWAKPIATRAHQLE